MSSDNDLIERTDSEQKRAIEIYDSFRDELLKRQLSNTENYDKSILTLSSSGLAISLTFLDALVPIEQAAHLWLMKTSWWCFLFSIICSLLAYLVSNAAISKQMSIAEDYYVNKSQSAFNKCHWLSKLNNHLNYAVGLLFVLAISSVVLFVTLNLRQEEIIMSKQENNQFERKLARESATVPPMQRVSTSEPSINSAQIPTMQAAPGATSSNQQASPSNQTQPQQPKIGD
ncbi:hypothetical protein ACJLUZ_002144 [Vibrio cholerae]|uniref:hypothetical protein n=1 Tax=Vibrio cholerae TaxID=666 RepID=UPI0028F1DF45|nr:hypothetical protein [Vibrio cholerae]